MSWPIQHSPLERRRSGQARRYGRGVLAHVGAELLGRDAELAWDVDLHLEGAWCPSAWLQADVADAWSLHRRADGGGVHRRVFIDGNLACQENCVGRLLVHGREAHGAPHDLVIAVECRHLIPAVRLLRAVDRRVSIVDTVVVDCANNPRGCSVVVDGGEARPTQAGNGRIGNDGAKAARHHKGALVGWSPLLAGDERLRLVVVRRLIVLVGDSRRLVIFSAWSCGT